MKRILLIIGFVVLVGGVCFLAIDRYMGWNYFVRQLSGDVAIVTISDDVFRVEVVTSPEDMARGLSFRNQLPKGHGMLFVFEEKELAPSFWMKDMRFPIDLVWISEGVVTGVEQNLPFPEAGKPPASVTAPGFVTDVLEIPAGEAEGVEAGMSVTVTY